ncbi:MAG: stage II sporulation protein M [Thermoanaerobacteraceae bacterium]|nr:stage II sporulation protein M [Thermoanaerobacteraceae bacterium]
MNYFPKILIDYLKRNIIQYIFLSIILIIGIIIGSITVNLISDIQLENIQSFINGFLTNVNNISVDYSSIFYLSMSNNMKTAVLLILLGLSVVGIPFILGIILFRGFVLGFTVGFLIEELGSKGLVLSVFSILPQNLIILPCIISIGVTGLTFATTVIKNRIKNYHENYSQMVSGYMLLNLFFSFLLIISGLIEGYISPIFIKFFSNYFSL